MTWLKILLWLLPIGLAIFGILLVVNRIRSHSSPIRMVIFEMLAGVEINDADDTSSTLFA